MSVVRKKPFIEQFLGKLTADQLTSLLSTINSDDTPIRYSLVDKNLFIPAYTEDAIGPVTLELEKGKAPYNGFLIHVTNTESNVVCLFIGHHRFQDIMLVSIDVTHRNFTKIHEDCDINELRRVLADKMDESGATSDLTPAKLESILKGSESIVVDRSEDGEHTVVKLDQDFIDLLTLVEVDDATLDENGVISFTVPDLIKNRHIEVMFEVENAGTHFGGNLIVHPKDTSVCFSAGIVDANGSFVNYTMTNDDGQININFASDVVASTDTIKVHYRVL